MKKPVLIALLCLCASLVVMFFGFRGTPQSAPAKTHSITLLTQEDTGSFLLQLRYGAEAACNGTGDKLSVLTLDPKDTAGQIEELSKDDISAILLYAGDDALVSEVAQACDEENLPLVLLGRTAENVSCAASDEIMAGRLAVQQARSLNATRVICMTDNSDLTVSRMDGVMDEFASNPDNVLRWDGWQNAQTMTEDVLRFAEQGAAVIALSEDATLAAVKMRSEGLLGSGTLIIAIEANPDQIDLLEKGVLSALILPAPYTISYRGCGMAIAALNGSALKSVLIQPKQITLDNLYSAENVNITFPLLQ